MEQEQLTRGDTHDSSGENGAEWQDLAKMSQEPPAINQETYSTKPETFASPLDYIEKTGLADSEQVEALVQNGTYEDFKVHLVRLNALFRNLSPEQHSIDGESVRIQDNLLPISSEYKEQVVESAFAALKDMPPKDRGVLMYNILGAVHLFRDGNGRSMRVWHHLLAGEPLDSEGLARLTEHNDDTQSGIATTGRKEIQSHLQSSAFFTSGVVNYKAFTSIRDEVGAEDIRSSFPLIEPEFDENTIKELSIAETNRVKDICSNDTGAAYCPFNILTMHTLAKEDPSFKTPPAELENDKSGNKIYMYDNEQSPATSFTAEQAKRFIAINNELKLKHFQTMIDIFRKPAEYTNNNGKQLKEFFYTQK